jgi:hypothetical protein
MKKLTIIGLLFICINSFSQNSAENIKNDVEIQIEIDSSIYEIKQGEFLLY